MSKRKKCSPEFKQHAVELTRMGPGIGTNMISRWTRKQEKHGAKAFQGQGKAQDEEMALLRRELVITL